MQLHYHDGHFQNAWSVSFASLPLLPLACLLFSIDMSCHWSSYLCGPSLVFFHWLEHYSKILPWSNPEQSDFSLYNRVISRMCLSADVKNMNGMFSFFTYGSFTACALYFMLPLVFFSCSFTPSL